MVDLLLVGFLPFLFTTMLSFLRKKCKTKISERKEITFSFFTSFSFFLFFLLFFVLFHFCSMFPSSWQPASSSWFHPYYFVESGLKFLESGKSLSATAQKLSEEFPDLWDFSLIFFLVPLIITLVFLLAHIIGFCMKRTFKMERKTYGITKFTMVLFVLSIGLGFITYGSVESYNLAKELPDKILVTLNSAEKVVGSIDTAINDFVSGARSVLSERNMRNLTIDIWDTLGSMNSSRMDEMVAERTDHNVSYFDERLAKINGTVWRDLANRYECHFPNSTVNMTSPFLICLAKKISENSDVKEINEMNDERQANQSLIWSSNSNFTNLESNFRIINAKIRMKVRENSADFKNILDEVGNFSSSIVKINKPIRQAKEKVNNLARPILAAVFIAILSLNLVLNFAVAGFSGIPHRARWPGIVLYVLCGFIFLFFVATVAAAYGFGLLNCIFGDLNRAAGDIVQPADWVGNFYVGMADRIYEHKRYSFIATKMNFNFNNESKSLQELINEYRSDLTDPQIWNRKLDSIKLNESSSVQKLYSDTITDLKGVESTIEDFVGTLPALEELSGTLSLFTLTFEVWTGILLFLALWLGRVVRRSYYVSKDWSGYSYDGETVFDVYADGDNGDDNDVKYSEYDQDVNVNQEEQSILKTADYDHDEEEQNVDTVEEHNEQSENDHIVDDADEEVFDNDQSENDHIIVDDVDEEVFDNDNDNVQQESEPTDYDV